MSGASDNDVISRAAMDMTREAMLEAQKSVSNELRKTHQNIQETNTKLQDAVFALQERVKQLSERNAELEENERKQRLMFSSAKKDVNFERMRRQSIVGGVHNEARFLDTIKNQLIMTKKSLAEMQQREMEGAERVRQLTHELELQSEESKAAKRILQEGKKQQELQEEKAREYVHALEKHRVRYETLLESHKNLKEAHAALLSKLEAAEAEILEHRNHRADIDARAEKTVSRIRNGSNINMRNMSDTEVIDLLQKELIAASHALSSAQKKEAAAKLREDDGVKRIKHMEDELALQTQICTDLQRKNKSLEAQMDKMDVSALQQTIKAQSAHLEFARNRYKDAARQLRETNELLATTEGDLATTRSREKMAKLQIRKELWGLLPSRPDAVSPPLSQSPRRYIFGTDSK